MAGEGAGAGGAERGAGEARERRVAADPGDSGVCAEACGGVMLVDHQKQSITGEYIRQWVWVACLV